MLLWIWKIALWRATALFIMPFFHILLWFHPLALDYRKYLLSATKAIAEPNTHTVFSTPTWAFLATLAVLLQRWNGSLNTGRTIEYSVACNIVNTWFSVLFIYSAIPAFMKNVQISHCVELGHWRKRQHSQHWACESLHTHLKSTNDAPANSRLTHCKKEKIICSAHYSWSDITLMNVYLMGLKKRNSSTALWLVPFNVVIYACWLYCKVGRASCTTVPFISHIAKLNWTSVLV